MRNTDTDADPLERADDDEIEILEIVGLDEDAAPAAGEDAWGADPADGATDEAELVLDLDAAAAAAPARAADSERERLLRLGAEFDNYRKRVEREREANERHAAANLVTRLLPVLDNFERALSQEPPPREDPNFRDGVALIFRHLLDELRKEGLTAVDSVGEPFNPEVHEAVATLSRPELPTNTVVEEIQRGYLLHERLLRPALVVVNVDPAGRDGAQ